METEVAVKRAKQSCRSVYVTILWLCWKRGDGWVAACCWRLQRPAKTLTVLRSTD